MTINKYRFDYRKDPEYPNYKEYDGTVINAPDEKTAILTFDGISGEFGMANSDKYDIIKIGVAYAFDGDFEAWKQAVNSGEVE